MTAHISIYKLCPVCKLDKPDSEFYPDETYYPGWCRKCVSEQYKFELKEFEEVSAEWTKEQWIKHFSKL